MATTHVLDPRGDVVYTGSTFELASGIVGDNNTFYLARSEPSQEHLAKARKFVLGNCCGEFGEYCENVPCTSYLLRLGAAAMNGISQDFTVDINEPPDQVNASLLILPTTTTTGITSKQHVIEFERGGEYLYFHVHVLEALRRLDFFNRGHGISPRLFEPNPNEEGTFIIRYPFGHYKEYFFGKTQTSNLRRAEREAMKTGEEPASLQYDANRIEIPN